VCTIHQPSSILIQQFDMILALNPGGNTFYFGPVGENGSDVINYFGERGVHCPEDKNVAEFILETAAKPIKRTDGTKINWNDEWQNSQQAQDVIEEIEGLKLTRSKSIPEKVRKEQQQEFAAPVWTQTYEMTVRTFKQYWRDPSYIYGKLFVSVIVDILAARQHNPGHAKPHVHGFLDHHNPSHCRQRSGAQVLYQHGPLASS
jgi:ATP-binding cassette subfamily G (WHITE) protein 2 (SNQ2)